MPHKPFTIMQKTLDKLEKAAGTKAVPVEQSASVVQGVPRKQGQGYTVTQKAPKKAKMWLIGTYQGNTHRYEKIDEQRYRMACGHELHRPGFIPNGLSNAPDCETCVVAIQQGITYK